MTYEYLCTACDNHWEAEQSISAAPLKTCPQCGQDSAKRQVSGGAGFILKGGGWYADLYGSSKKESKSESSASTPSSTTPASTSTAASSTSTAASTSTATNSASSSGSSAPATKQGGASAS